MFFRLTTIAALFAASVSAPVQAAPVCSGADPAITSVTVRSVSPAGALTRYELAGTVVNLGQSAQPSSVLQFVDIYGDGVKLDAKGIPPLAPGQSYTFTYDSLRARDAGNGTTKLTFKLDPASGSSGAQYCSGGDRYQVSF